MARCTRLDPDAGLLSPPYKIAITAVERLGVEGLLVTYQVVTPPLEAQLPNNRNAFAFDVKVTAEFVVGPGMPDNQIGPFAHLGGLIVAWPFLRQTIADLSVRLGYPPLFLPLITVPVSPTGAHAAPNPQSNTQADQP